MSPIRALLSAAYQKSAVVVVDAVQLSKSIVSGGILPSSNNPTSIGRIFSIFYEINRWLLEKRIIMYYIYL